MRNFVLLFLFLLLPLSIYAQIPSGTILWLQADNGVIQTSGKITQWVDQSSKGNSVTQTVSSSQPLVVKNVLNGHSIIKFHGGGEFFNGPSVFPTNKDYTITAVVRIDDTTAINNIISGNNHAFFFGNSPYPRIVHADFNFQEISSLQVDSGFAIITIRYSNINGQAKVYVNGQSGDSLYVTSNSDSTIFIGAYQGAYTLNGAIAEILLFDRQISEKERDQLEAKLRVKYAIPLGMPAPKGDSTFTSLPVDLQLYPREQNDSASVPIEGTVYKQGYDSIYLDGFNNNLLYFHRAQALQYSENKAFFAFNPKIHAELSEYHFIVHLKNAAQDIIIADRNNIACGDVYFVGGESNSTFGYYNVPYRNEFCRSFGVNFSHNIRDTTWSLSTGELWGDGPSVSGWGLMLQKHFVEQEHIPTCIINEGVSGTILTHHLRDNTNPLSLETIYGRMLYRAQKAGVANAAKAFIWYHGELDLVDRYYENFKTLYQSWHENYPNLKKIYVIQLRPAFCVDLFDQPLRELMRTMPDSLHDITSISSTMFPHQDGCHFHDDGFSGISDQIFPILAHDFYALPDTMQVFSPNISKAFYTTPQNNEIALIFSPHNCVISATSDTIVKNINATIKDYFYPNDELGKVQSVRFSGDTVFLQLYSSSSGKFISYLPDRYYNGSDSVFYQGPWLKSSSGIGALIFYHFPINDWKNSLDTPIHESDLSLDVAPNPVHNSTIIRFHLPASAGVTLAVYDALGKKLRTLTEGELSEGSHEILFDASTLAAGEYFCRLERGERILTKKIILTK